MDSYRQQYYHLLHCMAKATSAMDKGDLIQAREVLIQAQQEAESRVLNELPEES
ncbi:hypothetical protein KQI82_02285 [Oscillibacter sp. MSJ-2]|uniref:Uncharacterized protein n=1 Tax=Dysosmobacter acutus TaxID=2841504 RepID=A0ABS6F841_9FIRM|nr:hypothetical protein [Dysosmobacter acutus]MBU5625762.1 hypothetical protein [Dysosmobacter acutus]